MSEGCLVLGSVSTTGGGHRQQPLQNSPRQGHQKHSFLRLRSYKIAAHNPHRVSVAVMLGCGLWWLARAERLARLEH